MTKTNDDFTPTDTLIAHEGESKNGFFFSYWPFSFSIITKIIWILSLTSSPDDLIKKGFSSCVHLYMPTFSRQTAHC